ncbi:MAG TPA: hypothetical protein VMU07_02240, partial [Candidatus Paceibacterota bacterium]|nr:hypothetical protein [Candidatus Paceibacterota bacterium]
MSNHSLKFLFLFVLIGVVLFSRSAYHETRAPLESLSANETQAVAHPSLNDPMGLIALKAATATTGSASSDPAPSVPTATRAAATVGYVIGDSTPAYAKVGNAAPPTLHDAESLIADLSNGSPLLSLNTNARWPLASLTKLMTAEVVYDRMDLNAHVTITPQMFAV